MEEKIIIEFAEKLVSNQKNIDPEIAKFLHERFLELL